MRHVVRASSIKGNGWSKPRETLEETDNPGTEQELGRGWGKTLQVKCNA